MKRLASQLSLVIAALAAAPAALAGSEILKCVDAGGHVTLTDQPCDSGARGTRLVTVSPQEGALHTPAAGAEAQTSGAQRYEPPQAMLRQPTWPARVPNRDRALARDVATLKAARAQLLLIDADRPHRQTLATIQ